MNEKNQQEKREPIMEKIFRVYTPNPNFNGTRSHHGVVFREGVALCNEVEAKAMIVNYGYKSPDYEQCQRDPDGFVERKVREEKAAVLEGQKAAEEMAQKEAELAELREKADKAEAAAKAAEARAQKAEKAAEQAKKAQANGKADSGK